MNQERRSGNNTIAKLYDVALRARAQLLAVKEAKEEMEKQMEKQRDELVEKAARLFELTAASLAHETEKGKTQ